MLNSILICAMSLMLNFNNYIKNIIADYDKNIDTTNKYIDPYYFDDSENKIYNYFYEVNDETQQINDINFFKLLYYNLHDKSHSYIINNEYYKDLDISFSIKNKDIIISNSNKNIKLKEIKSFIFINETLNFNQKINKNINLFNFKPLSFKNNFNDVENIYCIAKECNNINDLKFNNNIIKHNFKNKIEYLKYEGIDLQKVELVNITNPNLTYIIEIKGKLYPINIIFKKNNNIYIEYYDNLENKYNEYKYANENIYKVELIKNVKYNSIDSKIDWFIPEEIGIKDKLPCVKISNISILTYISNGKYKKDVDSLAKEYNLLNKVMFPQQQYDMLISESKKQNVDNAKLILLKNYPSVKDLEKELELNHIISIIVDLNKFNTPLDMENKIGDPSTGHVIEYHSLIVKGLKKINGEDYFELYNLWPLKNPYNKDEYYYKDYYIETNDLINCIKDSHKNFQYIVAYKA